MLKLCLRPMRWLSLSVWETRVLKVFWDSGTLAGVEWGGVVLLEAGTMMCRTIVAPGKSPIFSSLELSRL